MTSDMHGAPAASGYELDGCGSRRQPQISGADAGKRVAVQSEHSIAEPSSSPGPITSSTGHHQHYEVVGAAVAGPDPFQHGHG